MINPVKSVTSVVVEPTAPNATEPVSAKLNLDNVSEEENRKRIYVEIGKRFVSEHATAPEGYETFYRQLEEVEGRIEANKARLNQLKDEG